MRGIGGIVDREMGCRKVKVNKYGNKTAHKADDLREKEGAWMDDGSLVPSGGAPGGAVR